MIHVLNVCEVYYHLYRSAGQTRADSLEVFLREVGFTLVESLSSKLWRSAGKLKAEWRRVPLADCFAVALAVEQNARLVTSDHHELARLAAAGTCSIRFFR